MMSASGETGSGLAGSAISAVTADWRDASVRSILVSATTARDRPKDLHDRQMLAGLGHDAVIRGDYQQHEVDAVRAGQHGVHEALVPGDVDEADHAAVGLRPIGEAEVDGDAAGFFFRQAVCVGAGQRAYFSATICRGQRGRQCR